MQNDMRDRLIKDCEDLMCFCQSINCYKCDHKDIPYPRCMGVRLADHLIASNDVIVPPCKVGETLYLVQVDYEGTYGLSECLVGSKITMLSIMRAHEEHTVVYMSTNKAEAEEKLKELEGNK